LEGGTIMVLPPRNPRLPSSDAEVSETITADLKSTSW